MLKERGINQKGIEYVSKSDFSETHVFHLGDKPYQIDFLTKMVGLSFDESIQKAVFLNIENAQIPVLQLDDLIINKMLSNRMKDKADVEELQLVHKTKKN